MKLSKKAILFLSLLLISFCGNNDEINESTSPLEAGLNWVVKFDKGDFIGKSALINKQKKIR